MGDHEFKLAKKMVLQTGIFSTVVKGVPARTYYQINLKVLFDLITKHSPKTPPTSWAETDQLEGTEPTSQLGRNRPTITEKKQSLNKEDNNNRPKAIGCSMAVTKKKSHVEPKLVVQPKPQPELKVQPTAKDEEPIGSVVVGAEIDDLARMVKAWAISRVMVETWAKKHGVEYVLEKIELTQSAIALNRVKKPGAYLNKAIELDWQPPAPHEEEGASHKSADAVYPTHEENVAWYNALADNQKLETLKAATHKNAYLEDYLKNAKVSVLDADFSETTWFKMLMSCLGRAA